jgi:hypothetical protein
MQSRLPDGPEKDKPPALQKFESRQATKKDVKGERIQKDEADQDCSTILAELLRNFPRVVILRQLLLGVFPWEFSLGNFDNDPRNALHSARSSVLHYATLTPQCTVQEHAPPLANRSSGVKRFVPLFPIVFGSCRPYDLQGRLSKPILGHPALRPGSLRGATACHGIT